MSQCSCGWRLPAESGALSETDPALAVMIVFKCPQCGILYRVDPEGKLSEILSGAAAIGCVNHGPGKAPEVRVVFQTLEEAQRFHLWLVKSAIRSVK